MIKKLLLILPCMFILSSCTDTYDECIYNKIKACDDNKACVGAARNLCDTEFPYVQSEWKEVSWSDIDNSENKIQINSPSHNTKLCIAAKDQGIEEVCLEWNYDYELSQNRYGIYEILVGSNLDNFKNVPIENITYKTYRADRYRKGSKP